LIGETLGNRYRLLRELGAGGMAWVYQAEDLTERSLVAVKILYPQYNQDISYVERFLREARLALQISSEHVVRVLDYGADRDLHYLVMEQIRGKDLATVLSDMGRLPCQETLRIGVQVARALEAANAQGVVHRDIKPENIMIDARGLVKVLDFGIARARELPTVTEGGFVGSPSYISPEQAMGKRVDIRSDIYSLGIVLYEALSGSRPFNAETSWSIISQHIAQEPPKMDLADDCLPAPVEALIVKMLSKAPEDRFQTPSELGTAIEAILQSPDEGITPPHQDSLSEQGAADRDKARQLLLSSMYQRSMEAAQSEAWPQAVNLLNQILKVDPGYKDASEQLKRAGVQARLVALYKAAQDALAAERWQEAVDELGEIISVDPEYRDTAELLTQAGMSLAESKTRERLADLYQAGCTHYQNERWQEAESCLAQVVQIDTGYQDAGRLYVDARRRARWSKSVLGRARRGLNDWLRGTDSQDTPAHSGDEPSQPSSNPEAKASRDDERDHPFQA
jgi:serine/threonine protein kinase